MMYVMITALVIWLHLLVFVYWLGGDLGVFYLSRVVTDPRVEPATRLHAVKALMVLDLAPRLSLIATLPTGLTLAWVYGWLPLSPFVVSVIWLVAACWLALALMVHHRPASNGLRNIDLAIRVALLITLTLTAWLADLPLFIAVKLQLVALIILLGIWVRKLLQGLAAGLTALEHGNTDTANPLIEASLGACRLPVAGIWIIVAAAAFIGVLKPL